MECDILWSAALDELQMQVTRATFDTWLRGTTATGQDGTLDVMVKSVHAQEWLEARLHETISRVIARLAGEKLEVRFLVAESGGEVQPDVVVEECEVGAELSRVRVFTAPEFDVHEAGWFPVSEYECRFWAPVMGRVAWRVWEIVRKGDRRRKKTDWTPAQRFTVPALAAQVPCGKQAIVGVDRWCRPEQVEEMKARFQVWQDGERWRYHQPGAFDRLRALGVAEVQRRGQGRHTTYWISVRTQLGLLQPSQAQLLPSWLQIQHDRWLADHGFAPEDWDV